MLAVRFQLVSLNIQVIPAKSTIYQRRKRLRKITDGFELKDVVV